MSNSKVYRGKMNMESLIIYASQKHMERTGETRKYQNYPNLGIGARGISNRNRIYNKTFCCNYQYTTPTAPTGITVISRDSTSMNLSISSSDRQVTGYKVTLTSIGSGTNIERTTTSKIVTISGLNSETYYSIRIIAYNPAGNSTPYIESYNSNDSPFYTTIAPPTNLRVTSAGTTGVTIKFTRPSQYINVLSYTISYSSTLGTNTITGISVEDLTTEITNQVTNYLYAITNLTPGILYTIMVYAVGSNGNSSSITVTEDTLTEPPSNLILTAISTSSIGISYTAPSLSVTIDKYKITYGVYGSSSTTSIDIAKNITSYTLGSLLPNTQYTISVVTNNKNGDSTGDSTAITSSKYTLPNPPSSISKSNISATGVTITFGSPSQGIASSYILTYYPTNSSTNATSISNATSPTTITGLTSSLAYTVKVKSVNGDGSGYSSDASTTFTTSEAPLVAPGVPMNLATASKTDDSITVSYSAPSNGGTVSTYNIQYSLNASTGWSADIGNGTNLTYTISGLLSNTPYYIKVKATNASGSSDYTDYITVTTDAIDVYVPKNFTERLTQTVTL